MDLIYYYPTKNDAPAKVGLSILKYLDIQRTSIEKLNVFVENKKRCIKFINDRNYNKLGLLDVLFYERDSIVHIPISPNIFPNKKFILHLFALLKKKKLILHFHGNLHEHFVSKIKYEKKIDFLQLPTFILAPLILRKTSFVVTHSYLLADFLKTKYGLLNVCVIPNGLEDCWFEPVDDCYTEKCNILSENCFSMFYHGRLSHEKGVDLLIKTLSSYLETNENAILYIAGDGTQKEYLQSLAHGLNISEKVIFLGNLSVSEIKYYLKKVNIAIYPSRFDNFPLAMLEACASAECPVLLSINSGICDFIKLDGYNLKMINPKTCDIFEALSEVNELKKQVPTQKKFASNYKWENVIKHYIDLYNKICALSSY